MSKTTTQMAWYSTCYQKTPEETPTTLAELIEDIKSDPFKKTITAVRAEANKDKRAKLKQQLLPAVSISGAEAEGRKVTKHSGLLQIDLDGITGETPEALRDRVEYDPHIAAAFVSPSGDGLKIIMAIPASIKGHAKAFEAASNYIEKQYGRKPDSACKDLTRLCFVSHDPDAWCKDAEPLDVEEWLPTNDTPTKETPSEETPSEETPPEVLREKYLNSLLTTLENPPPKPRVVISANDGCIIAETGGVVTIEGQQKSGKTAVIGAILASAIAGPDSEGDFLGLRITPEPESLILHFDCEQSKGQHWRLIKTAITQRAELLDIPPRLKTANLLDVPQGDRWKLIEEAIHFHTAEGHRIGLIVLDGVADVVAASVNDDLAAAAFVANLLNYADAIQTVFVCVLHENPGGNGYGKTRGHLGSELWRKSQGCIGVEKGTDEISVVWGKYLRNGSWPKKEGASFRYDLDAEMHVSCDNPTEERKAAKEAAKKKEHETTAREILTGRSMRYGELVAAICEREKIQPRTARERIEAWVENGIVEKNEGGNYVLHA